MIINEIETFNDYKIAAGLNDYFVNIGANLAANIPECETPFTSYIDKTDKTLIDTPLSEEEIKNAWNSLKRNKASGFDDISSNVIKSSYDELITPIYHICNIYLKAGIFPNNMKIAKVIPLFKSDAEEKLKNYRPISILPVFSKILERVIYNRIYSHVSENNLLYEKQFGFQKNNSTEYAILKESFHDREFTVGVFIDLSKAFDTVDHNILLTKLTYFGLSKNYIKLIKNYLSNRKQFISYNCKTTALKDISCGVPQGSILGPLLFLLYANDLKNASASLNAIMFADDTNLFVSHKDINTLFQIVNAELKNLETWFNGNKLSLNLTKTKYAFFHPKSYSDDIPLRLPALKINNSIIKRESTVRFLGVLLDENLTWRPYIDLIENKISKYLGILYNARRTLNEECTKQLYFSFIHSYLNYGSITWSSTNKTKLKTLHRRQKHAARIIYFKDRFTHSKPLMQSLKALNIYQLNIYKTILFMYNVKNNNIPRIFKSSFTTVINKYNTRSSERCFNKPYYRTKNMEFSIMFRGPYLWNNIVKGNYENTSLQSFKTKLKNLCIEMDNEDQYF